MIISEVKIIEEKVFDIFTLKLREDGILLIHLSGEKSLNINQYICVIAFIGEMLSGRRVPMLITTDEFVLIDDEVRNLMLKKHSNPYSLGSAIITKSTAQKIIGNFFINTQKPERLIKIFSNEKDALKWLRSLL